MGKVCKVDVTEIQQLREKLEEFKNFNKLAVMKKIAQEIAQELVDTVIPKTPYKTGLLQKSWKISDVRVRGKNVLIYVYNDAKNEDGQYYASFVEYDHDQEVGRYVKKLGKRLVQPTIKGQFFLKKSVEIVDDMTPAIIKRELEKALKDLLNAK